MSLKNTLEKSKNTVFDRRKTPTVSQDFNISFERPIVSSLNLNCKLIWMKNVPNETARIDLYFDAGSSFAHPLIPSITSAMLLTGSLSKSSKQIHEELDFYGAYYSIEVTQFHCVVHLYGLRENIQKVLEIFVDAMKNMATLESEYNLILEEKKQKLAVNLKKVGILAQRKLQQVIFDGTPLKRIIKLHDFDKISIEKIRRFHREHFLTGLSRIHIVGAINDKDLNKISKILQPISSKIKKNVQYKFKNLKTHFHIRKKGALQSAIRIGKICINKHHQDFIGFSILCTILGDYFGSRLMKNIREDKGYTYGIGCVIQEFSNCSVMLIVTEVGVTQREATIQEIKKEIEILQTKLVPIHELKLVKSYLLGQALKSADGPYAQLDLFTGVDMFDLDYNYYHKYLQELKNITSSELKILANKYLNWSDFSIVTAG